MALAFTLLSTLVLKTWTLEPSPGGSPVTVVALIMAAVAIAIIGTGMLLCEVRKPRVLCYTDSREPVSLPTLQGAAFHIFLSHVWSTGQDQMRIVKQQLLDITMFDASVFLDV